jgi:lysophospholipase L1-like esterase
LASDKNPESEYFGRILAAEGMDAVPATGYLSSGQGGGLYVFTPEFATDGKFFQAEPLKVRQLEFIGDSYTCGYGIDAQSRKERFTPETENASRSYAGIVSRYFGADYVAIAHSGMGIARNYNSKFKGWWMPDRYLQTFDEDSTQLTRWDATKSDFHPAMTVVYLGANDFSTALAPKYEDFRKHYYRLFKYIKANYGEDHPILCVATKTHEYLFNYVRDLVNNCNMENVHYLGYCPAQHLHTDEDLGADVHPNYNGQQKKAYSIIPYIATITGWGLQDMPVK